ncbi:hypothetical protein MMC06_001596 [Schaereria dolodes]|nr:hypothetical protein [Schaereria dolodes]
MSFAAPVSKNGFHYNGDLWVEVGGGLHRHKRASIAELTNLLRPEKKSRGSSLPIDKDNVFHWWEAQLMHYGLTPSKNKAVAKIRLLEALNEKSLTVPASTKILEEELRKEFSAAEKKAKAQHKAQMAGTISTVQPSNKRKQSHSEPSNVSNIQFNITIAHNGNMIPNFEGHATNADLAKAKKVRKASATTSMNTNTTTQAPEAKAIKQKKTPAKTSAHTYATIQVPGNTAAAQTKPTKQQSDKSFDANPSPAKPPGKPVSQKTLPTSSKVTLNSPVGKKAVLARKESSGIIKRSMKKDLSMKKEDAIKKEPSTTKKSVLKKEPKVKNESTSDPGIAVRLESQPYDNPSTCPSLNNTSHTVSINPPTDRVSQRRYTSLGLINGTYIVRSADSIMEQCSYEAFIMLSLDGDSLWGSFDLGAFRGVMLFPQRPYRASDEPIGCHWRGMERDTGNFDGGDHCVGDVAFLGDGNIEGTLNLDGGFRFTAHKSSPLQRHKSTFKDEWEDYGDAIYG